MTGIIQRYCSTLVLLLLLFGGSAGAQTADLSPEAAQVEAANRLVKQATDALWAARLAAQRAATAQAATAQIALLPPAQHTTEVTIPSEIRDAVLSLCGILITAGIGTGLTWMRAHFAFMKEAGANAAITSSAQGFGALLEQALAKHGKSLSSVEISDPTVAMFARKLISSYPEWGPLVGLTQDIAERKVLGGAIVQSTAPLVPTKLEVVVPKPDESPPLYE